ncbi:MAG: hypothetical protein IPJ41_06940 [Phycisphaerales bacterium]|nr:hypothetical protein [Phycisphaerales bacterium]
MHSRSILGVLLALSPALVGAAPVDDQAIDALIERMEHAVLAADADAYLACVDQAEAEWAKEQTNWAADLAGHAPEDFDIALQGDLSSPDGTDGWVVGDIRMSWQIPGSPRRSVTFPASFMKRGESWLYAGEAWQRVQSSDGENVVLYLDDSLHDVAEKVIGMMPEIREHVDEGFETHLDHPQVIKLYADMRHLQQSIYLSYEDSLGGWNEPGEAIKVLADADTGARTLRVLLSHEYGHVATFTFGPGVSDNFPWWVAEGVAELAAEKYAGPRATAGEDEMVRAWAATGGLADWADMADFRQTPLRLQPNVYVQGHHFVGWLSERFGRAARNTWLRALADGQGLDEATRTAFGDSFEDLDHAWRASLQPEPRPTDNH